MGIFNAKPTKQTVVLHNHHPMDTVRISECYVTIADECKEAFRDHVEKRLRYFPDSFTADKAADIMGYAKNTVLAYIQQKRIFQRCIKEINFVFCYITICKNCNFSFEIIRDFYRLNKRLVAFSGTVNVDGQDYTEAGLNIDENGQALSTDKKFRKAFRSDRYNILVVANKYQTGFDEPLLHSMYTAKYP